MLEGRIDRYREFTRGTLIALAAPVTLVGGWALVAPHGWYTDFPLSGRHWVSALGPYDEHLVRDFGSVYLGLGLLLFAAAIFLSRQLVLAATGVMLVFSVPHFIFHMTKLDELPTGDNVVNMVSLGLGLVASFVLFVFALRPDAGAAARPAPTIEGGVEYGTR
jgi:hypothetical protein